MKILTNIVIPAVSENYDVLVPDFLPVSEITPLVAKAVTEITNGRYVPSGCELLCWKEKETVLDGFKTLGFYGVQNGDHIILF